MPPASALPGGGTTLMPSLSVVLNLNELLWEAHQAGLLQLAPHDELISSVHKKKPEATESRVPGPGVAAN